MIAAPLQRTAAALNDTTFRQALDWRLDITERRGVCQNWNVAHREQCGNVLTDDHAASCPCGPLRNKWRQAVVYVWCDVCGDAGCSVTCAMLVV